VELEESSHREFERSDEIASLMLLEIQALPNQQRKEGTYSLIAADQLPPYCSTATIIFLGLLDIVL
jgi:hypothetical protein